MVANWKERALEMYKAGTKINNIAHELNKSRKTISKYINSLENKAELTENKKKLSAERRKEKKKEYRYKGSRISDAIMKRQHDIDVRVLSSEKYFN